MHVLDLYADGDTSALALSVSRIGSIATGFRADRLLDSLHRIEAREGIDGIVAGSGFEERIDLLEAMARVGRLLGNPPEVVRRAKDPACFFPLLARLGIPHPETVTEAPAGSRAHGTEWLSAGWLCKRIGGAGGAHVRPAEACCPPGHYLQRRVPGRPHSLVFLADGRHAAIVGYNEIRVQDGTGAARFRYTGAVTVSEPPVAPAVEDAVQALVPALGLVGLCGLDFMLDEDGRYSVLEVNPRPTGTFELYEDLGVEGPGLFQMHLSACERPVASHGSRARQRGRGARGALGVRDVRDPERSPMARLGTRSPRRRDPPPGRRADLHPACARGRAKGRGSPLVGPAGQTLRGARVAASGIDQIDQRVQQDTKDFAMTNKSVPVSVNARTRPLVDALVAEAPSLRIAVERLANGTQVIDAGIKVPGGLEAGRRIAEICLGGLGQVRIRAGSAFANWMVHVDVYTSDPIIACLGSQYAGWSLEHGQGKGAFRALGSGPGARVGQP